MPYLHLDDTEFYYEVHGAGPPFLFLPATDAPGAVWTFFQVPEFSRDHRVIICDQRGSGKSKTRSADFTTRRMAADAAALLDHLGARGAIAARDGQQPHHRGDRDPLSCPGCRHCRLPAGPAPFLGT